MHSLDLCKGVAKPLLYITHLHQTLNAPSHPIRHRLLHLLLQASSLRKRILGKAIMRNTMSW